MEIKVNKSWFQTLKNYVKCGKFNIAIAYILSYFILTYAPIDEIAEIPLSIDEHEWELYLSYFKEKFYND